MDQVVVRSYKTFFGFKCHLIPPLVDVHLTSPLGVDGVPLVRVDDNLGLFSLSSPTLIVIVLESCILVDLPQTDQSKYGSSWPGSESSSSR